MEAKFESVQRDAGSGLRCHHFSCSSLASDHTWHYHPEFELTWVIRSSGTRFIGDSVARYGSGDLVLVGPNVPHRWRDDPSACADAPELIVVQFDASCLGEKFLSLPEASAICHLLEQSACGVQFASDTVQLIGGLLRDMVAHTGMQRLIDFLNVLNSLSAAVNTTRLARPDYQFEKDINPVHRRRIEIVYDLVHAELANEICQAKVACKVGLSAPAFSRFFKAVTGRTFVCFVNLVRVGRACRLLTSTSLSITAIALDCGYGNLSNFNRQFHALKGMNPTEFRRLSLGHSLSVVDLRSSRAVTGRHRPHNDIRPAQSAVAITA